jgi:hypothetical protein
VQRIKKKTKQGQVWKFCVGAKIKKKIREAFQPDKLPFRASGKFQFSFLSFDDGIGGFWFCVGGKI